MVPQEEDSRDRTRRAFEGIPYYLGKSLLLAKKAARQIYSVFAAFL